MKISTKGRYALRVMLELALRNDDSPMTVKELSEKQNLSVKYLEQIIGTLNKAGYVNSLRGAQGGYVLAKKPSEYTVGMILRLTEGSLAPVACVEGKESCERSEACDTLFVWQEIYDAVNRVVDSITLEDILNRCNARNFNLNYII